MPPKILDKHYKTRLSTDHRVKFHAGRHTHFEDLARKKIKIEIWSKAQRESARRRKSDWGILGVGSKKVGNNFLGIKVTWPELKCIDIRRKRIFDLG